MLALIIFTAFLLRIIPLGFPQFTSDEARIALRAYTLNEYGSDEGGRKHPFIFNSLTDYQLPITSYIASAGVSIFGKSDLGVRLPFILVGTIVVLLSYMAASIFNPSRKFRLLVALVTAFSPVAIFLSRVPNETILVTFLFLLQLLLLTRKNFNLPANVLVFVLLLSTSKIAWFILVPFTAFTLLVLQKDFSKKAKVTIFISLLLTTFTIFIFLKIPQSIRSLMENNFPIFSSETVKNGIDKLRGQGIQEGWPPFLERMLFNKLDYFFVGFFHWLSHLNLGSKILIIPLVIGLIHLIKRSDKKLNIQLFGYIIIVTFPLLFVYPRQFPEIVALSLPFMFITVAYGLINIKKWLTVLIIITAVLEIIIYNPSGLRPAWIKQIVEESYSLTKQDKKVALSDDIVEDIIPFFGLYTQIKSANGFSMIDFPYRFREYQLPNIKLIGFDNEFRSCGREEKMSLILSNRDLDKAKKDFEINVESIFKDSLNKTVAYKLKNRICVN